MNNLPTTGATLRMPLALLLVSSLVTGVALTANDASTARVETPAIGAWLGTDDTGVVSHVGPAGVDASVEIRPPVGQLSVHVVDGQVVLSDEGGNVTRLDDAALAVGQEEQIGTSARLAGGGDRLYTVDAATNSVQELDPTELRALGESIVFETGAAGIGLGDAVVDDSGTLWVADGSDGSVLEILGSDLIERHGVSTPGVQLDLALTDSGAVAVDPSTRTVQLVESGTPHALPFASAMTAPDHVDGTAILPVVAEGQVALIDPETGTLNVVDLDVGSNELGVPVVAGNRVLIPDLTDGVLHVVELDSASAADDIALPEQTDDFEMISDGTVAYVNDRTSTDVWIIAPDGSVVRDDKFDPDSLEDGVAPPAESDEPGDDAEIELPPPPATPPSANPTPRPPASTPPAATPPAVPTATPPTGPPAEPTRPPTTEPTTPNSDPEDNTPPTGDGSVTIDSVTAGVAQATVVWSAPTDWLAVDRYLVRVFDADGNVVQEQPLGADITRFEATGLANGVEHRFEVTASSGDTVGAPVLSAAVRPDVTGDGAVINLTANATAGSVTATWAEPSGWYEVAEYVVVVTGPSGEVDVEQVGGDVFEFSSTLVTNGTTYNITVNAVGVDGQVGPEVTSDPVTPIDLVPAGDGAVTITATSADGAMASVTWTEPTDWYTITGYDIVVLNDDGSEYTAATVDVTGTTVSVGSLVNGRAFRVQITSLSDQGPGLPTVSDPLTPYGDGAVTNMVVAAGDGSVQATWDAPVGWYPVADYTVEISPGGISETVSASTTSYSRSALTNGQTYTLRVTANLGSGVSGRPVTSAQFTPAADLPSAPLNVTVLVGPGSITLGWTAPASGTVGSYRIDAVPVDGSPTTTQTVDGSRTSLQVRGLTSGLTYDVFIHALHPSGALGAVASSQNITPSGPPSAPGVTNAPTSSTDGTSVTLQWTAPNTNGSQITDYVVNGRQVSGPVVATDVVVAATATTFTVTGLQPTTQYSFTVAARSDFGQGAPATFANITTATPAAPTPPPNPPQNLQGVGDVDAVDLTWVAPATNAAAIASYELSIGGNSAISLPATAISHRWSGLASSSSYTFVLRAVGADGQMSNPTAFTASTTAPPVPAPSVPTGVVASPLGQTSVRVSWNQPNPANTSSWIIGYNSGRATSSATSIDLTGLAPGTTYQILVWSVGPTGLQSGSSTPINVTTTSPPPIPGAVGGLYAFVETTLFDAGWNAPSGATGYRISVDGGAPIDVGNTTRYSRADFTSDSGTVTVWAYNSSGQGPPSTVGYADICPGPVAC